MRFSACSICPPLKYVHACIMASRTAMESKGRKEARADIERIYEEAVEVPLLEAQIPEHEYFDWTAAALPFFFPAMGGLLYGFDSGATSGAAVSLTDPVLSGTSWCNLTTFQSGLVVSGSLYGALLGSILAFKVADFLGRRLELILAAGFYFFGSLITPFCSSFLILILGRLVFGLGIGLAMHSGPMYIAETSPSPIRGILVSLNECLVVVGILLGYLVGSLTVSTIGGWRYMFGMGAPLACLMAIGMWLLPPSPRWLLLRGVQGLGGASELKERSSAALKTLRGSKVSQAAIDVEVEDTWFSLEIASNGQGHIVKFSELFQGVNLKALWIGLGLVFFQQVSGQPSVLYYAAPILQSAGFGVASDATKFAVLLGFFKLIMTAVAVVYVDRLGRRPLLIGGVGGVAVSLFLLASYFAWGQQSVPWLALIALLLYVGCYQVSFGPISWLMVSEIFPLRTRSRALSLTTLVNFGTNALVALAFAPVESFLGDTVTFLIFGVIAVIAVIFIIEVVPETKGLSLEQIEAKLLNK